jgi:hypothetical protein
MTRSRSWADACRVASFAVVMGLNPELAQSDPAKPTEFEVDRAIQSCAPEAQNDENIVNGLKLLRKRMLAEEGAFPLTEIPGVTGVGLKADTAIVPLFDKIQKCAVDRLSGRVPTYPTSLWFGLKFMDRGDFGALDTSRSHFLIKIDGRPVGELDFSKPLASQSLELTEGEHHFEFSGELHSEDGAQILRGICAGNFQMGKSAILAPHVKLDKAKGAFGDCTIRTE